MITYDFVKFWIDQQPQMIQSYMHSLIDNTNNQ